MTKRENNQAQVKNAKILAPCKFPTCLASCFEAPFLSFALPFPHLSDYVAVSTSFAILPLFFWPRDDSYFASQPDFARNREVRLPVVARRRSRGLAMRTALSRVALAIRLVPDEKMQDFGAAVV